MARAILTTLMGDLPHEEMHILMLDVRSRIIGSVRVSQGGMGAAAITAGDILRPAIVHCARALIVGHNHPSGDTTPSRDDLNMTRQLQAACGTVGIVLLDHIIVNGTEADAYSMEEHGDITS